jgi:hypothetical protein
VQPVRFFAERRIDAFAAFVVLLDLRPSAWLQKSAELIRLPALRSR